MNRRVYVDPNCSGNTDPWWWLLVALSTLVLCSCRSLHQDKRASPATGKTALEDSLGLYPRETDGSDFPPPPCSAWDNNAEGFCLCVPSADQCSRCGEDAIHPRDEYLCDGGDAVPAVQVDREWNVRGLTVEDTVAHFDTLDGRVQVRASNRVCLYAPRFAVTRKVRGVMQRELALQAGRVNERVVPVRLVESEPPESIKQNQSSVRQVGLQITHAVEERERGLLVEDVDQLRAASGKLLPFEDLQIIRWGVFDASERARLGEGLAAAELWSAVQTAQVVLDGKLAASQTRATQPQALLYVSSESEAQLRLIKIASRRDALPGDVVEFTLRFDNVGHEAIGNVTLIDNLTTRLEYVSGSQQCSRQATFIQDANAADSLKLEWRIEEPLEPGEGGIVRFQCRVK